MTQRGLPDSLGIMALFRQRINFQLLQMPPGERTNANAPVKGRCMRVSRPDCDRVKPPPFASGILPESQQPSTPVNSRQQTAHAPVGRAIRPWFLPRLECFQGAQELGAVKREHRAKRKSHGLAIDGWLHTALSQRGLNPTTPNDGGRGACSLWFRPPPLRG